MMSAALSSLPLPALADQPAPLDKDFLDYLATCESKDDNWTVIADDKQRRKATEKTPPKPAVPADKVATKPETRP